ncbi:hypothetical protein D3C84_659640 [compost metagenome]
MHGFLTQVPDQAVEQHAKTLAIDPQLPGRHSFQGQRRDCPTGRQLRVESRKSRFQPLNDVQLDRHQRWAQLIQVDQLIQLLQTQAQALQGDLAGERQTRVAETQQQTLQRFLQVLMNHPGKTGYIAVFGLSMFMSIA